MTGSADPIRVLHVDDDPEFADLAAEYLERQEPDLVVEQAIDSDEGLEALRETDFDCVVSDYDMPSLDGIEFLRSVRERAPDLPFILFTGKGSEEVASEAISAGVTDYLQKGAGSSQFELLANRIENAVEQREAQRTAERTQRRLQTLAENTNDILWMYTADWEELLFINSAYEDIWGRPIAELRQFPPTFQRGVHPDDRPITREAMDQLSAGESIDIEFRVNAEEDFSRWVWVQGEPIYEGGEVAKVVGFARDVTDWKDRNRELELMGQLVREMKDAAVIAQEGVIRYVNPQVPDLLGYSREEIHDVPMTEFIAPGDREVVAERHRARLTDDEASPPGLYEIELVAKDGSTVPVEINVSPTQFDGEPATLSLVRDISERRRRERERRRLKEEYEAIFETAQDGIFLLDVVHEDDEVRFEFSRLNPAHEATSGMASEAIRGKTPREVLGPEQGAEVAANYRRCVEAKEPIEYLEVLEMPSGTVHWQTKLGPVIDEAGEVTQIVGVARDITEQQHRELALERLHEATRELMGVETTSEVAEIGVETADRVLDLPIAGVHRFDAAADALVPVAWTAAVEAELGGPPPTIDAGTNLAWRAYADGEPQIHGDVHAVDSAMNPETPFRSELLLPLGDHGVFLAASTEPEAFDARDEALAQVLAANIEAALDRVEREQALKDQNERLDEFASIVSHDLRNPLNVAEGRLTLAAEECDSDHLEPIAEAHQRMEALIEDILLLARGEDEAVELTPVPLESVVRDCWSTVETGSAELHVETDLTLHADESRLRQLLENLIRNAVDHGGEDVTVEVGGRADGFYVEDDGPGIPESDREAVFDADFSTKETGVGLGLAIVEQVVEAHGWQLTVTDAADGGARFEVARVDTA